VALVPSSSRGGDGGPQTVYVQDIDPGEVGFGVVWVDTSLDDAAVPVWKVRNAADDDWDSPWAMFAIVQTEGNRLQNTEDDTSARLNLGVSNAFLTGRDGSALQNGGNANLEGGTGNEFAANGALVVAQAGRGTGEAGRVQVLTDDDTGTIGQVLTADGNGFATWEDSA
jgi:hypothetical protein